MKLRLLAKIYLQYYNFLSQLPTVNRYSANREVVPLIETRIRYSIKFIISNKL